MEAENLNTWWKTETKQIIIEMLKITEISLSWSIKNAKWK